MGDGPSIISPWPHPSRSDAAKRGVGCQTARCAGFRPAVSRDSAIIGKELLFARPPIFSAVRLRENWFLVPPSMMRLCPKPAVVSTTQQFSLWSFYSRGGVASNWRWVAGRCRWPGEGEVGNRSEVSGAGRKWGIGGLSAGLPADLGGVEGWRVWRAAFGHTSPGRSAAVRWAWRTGRFPTLAA